MLSQEQVSPGTVITELDSGQTNPANPTSGGGIITIVKLLHLVQLDIKLPNNLNSLSSKKKLLIKRKR